MRDEDEEEDDDCNWMYPTVVIPTKNCENGLWRLYIVMNSEVLYCLRLAVTDED